MAVYKYVAVDNQGRRVQGSCQAADRTEAVRYCRQQDLYVIHLSVKCQHFCSYRHLGMGTGDQILLFKRLAVLLDSGITLKDSLRSCQAERGSRLNDVIAGIISELDSGDSLTAALQKQHFAPLICAMVQSGENSGNLVDVLNNITVRLESRKALREHFLQALLYPCLVVSIGMLCFSVLLGIILPLFSEAFFQSGSEMPLTLQCLIDVKAFILQWYIALLAIAVALLLFIVCGLRQGRFDGRLLKMPVVGSYLLKQNLIIMAWFTAMMLKSGLTLSAALQQQIELTQNHRLRESWRQMWEKIAGGCSFSQALQQDKLIPPLFIQFVIVGESSGKLDYMLERAADYYREELVRQINWLSRIIEPLLLLAAGVFVLLLVLAMLLPGFALMDRIIL